MSEIMTTTDVARYYSERGFALKGWQVRRAYEIGLMPEPKIRMGQYRLISSDDLPELEKALKQMGYLPAEANALASGRANA